MDINVEVDSVQFDSTDGSSKVQGCIWRPEDETNVRGIVQLVHGMSEHIKRYDHFARFLVSQGFIVCGHDHVGHGSSVESKDHWGIIKMPNGNDVLVEDVHVLRSLVKTTYPADVPYIIFGHSMGSFIVRSYLARHGQGLGGAIICGTGFIPPATSKAGTTMAKLIAKVKGPHHKSNLLHSMGAGAYSKQIQDARTPLDWLSHNVENVERYIADEACGFMFSASGYAALTALTAEVCTPECAAKVPSDLPLLYIAGAEDPVGSNGEGVKQSYDLAVQAGSTDVTLKIFENMRHEILNETENDKVYAYILNWMEEHVCQKNM